MALVFASCAQPALPPATNAPADKSATQAPQKQAWEVEWQKTLDAAKKEGRVVLYTTAGPEIRTAFAGAMKDKYGLEMEFVTGRAAEMITKILNERRAGLFLGDAYMSGAPSAIAMLVPEGVIDPIIPDLVLPEVTDVTRWFGSKFPFVDNGQRFFGFRGSPFWSFTRNTDLVKAEELVSYNDLLKPSFKGKIAMGDPTITGASNAFVAMVTQYFMGRDFIKQLVKQEPAVSRDERQLTEWVARGKYSILVGTTPDPITEFMKAGAPLMPVIPKEGTMIEPGAGTVAVMNRRPHPNATRVFINWLLSKEGQTLYAVTAGIESAREDVSKAHLGAELVREPGKKYIIGDEEYQLAKGKVVQQSQEDFASLLR